MSKKHRNKKRRTKAKRRVKQKKKISVKQSGKKKKTTVKRLLSYISVGTLIAIISIWFCVKPRVSVQPDVALDPNNPVFTTFLIRNNGYLAIRDVITSNALDWAVETDKNVLIIGPGDYSDTFTIKEQFAPVIYPDQEISIEIYFSKLKYNQFGNMAIVFKISFRPHKWWPWRREMLRRFVSKKRTDGQWYWFPTPIKKTDRFNVNVSKNSNAVDNKH